MTLEAFKLKVELSGVPETMLWPLWNRAVEQKRPNKLIDDPMAAELIARIDYDFAGMFGKPSVFHAIRARLCDDLVKSYAESSKEAPVVVGLGDGLDTQAWRVADDRIRWFSVDLPDAIDVRNRLLPWHSRAVSIRCSALDSAWMDAIPATPAPFVSASGLLMYFEEPDVRRLLASLADRLPGAVVFFDTIPPFFSRRTLRGLKVTDKYTAPGMPWGISVDDIPPFLEAIPGVTARRVWTYADPFPERTRLYHLLAKIGPLRRRLAGGLVLAETWKPAGA